MRKNPVIPLACLILCNTSAAMAASELTSARPQLPDEIRALDKEIMLEGIKLAQFNIQFHNARQRQYKWRALIYPLVQESGSACVFANTLLDLAERAETIHDPSSQNKPKLKRGNEAALIGQSIKGTSFTAELCANLYMAHAADGKGFSYKRANDFVRTSVDKIDHLIEQRQAIVQDLGEAEQAKKALEGRMMVHLRNQLLYEYKMFSIDARERQWQQNSYYLMAAAQNFSQVGATIGSIQGFQIARNTPKVAITNITASGLGVAAPILRTLIGRSMREYQAWKLSRIFPVKRQTPRTLEQLKQDWAQLDEYKAQSHNGQQSVTTADVLGLDALIRRSDRADKNLRTEETHINHLRRVAQEQAISGPPIEMATLARQICQEYAYSHRNDSHLSNRINLGGRISQASGQAYSLVVTPTTAIKAALVQRKLRKKGELPSQVLAGRLKRLEALEQRVRSLNF